MSVDGVNIAGMNTHLTFRIATQADAATIVALIESCYRGDASRVGWTSEADLLDGQRTDLAEVTELLSREEGRFLMFQRDGELAATCFIERQGKVCYFGLFSVHPPLQGTGIGRLVLEEMERFARDEWACDRVEMTVINLRVELIAWYERRGYALAGRSKPFPYGDERFGIPRRDDLRLEFMEKALRA